MHDEPVETREESSSAAPSSRTVTMNRIKLGVLAGTALVVVGHVANLLDVYSVLEPIVWPAPPVEQKQAAGCLIVRQSPLGPQALGLIHATKADERGRPAGSLVFSTPGGMSRSGENLERTAERETLEETGFTVKAHEDLITFVNPENHVAFHLFHCEIDGDLQQRTRDQEAVGLLWARPSDVPSQAYRFPSQRDDFIEVFGRLSAHSLSP